ncbi:3-dehydro-L-gulonate 2-dehydrogenase [Ferruginibacter sp.]
MTTIKTIRVPAEEMQQVFETALLQQGFTKEKAATCAKIFTENSIDGVYTHGVNRFPRFIEYIQRGYVDKDAVATLRHEFGGIQQWNGNLGPGILNALQATDNAMALAQQFGIGCVALSNTNHWMRGGTYGWKAAKAGYVFIGWTNTTALMPAWGAVDAKLGNNPLVIAMPYNNEAIVLDMAMSQYSYGAMEKYVAQQERLPVNGGFDETGALTNDPAAILRSKRSLPIGYWKGAGLSLLLDLLAAILSGGLAVCDIKEQQAEQALSQVFIAIDIAKLGNASAITQTVEHIIKDYKNSIPATENDTITWPGERVLAARKKNLAEGIPVMENVWQRILQL